MSLQNLISKYENNLTNFLTSDPNELLMLSIINRSKTLSEFAILKGADDWYGALDISIKTNNKQAERYFRDKISRHPLYDSNIHNIIDSYTDKNKFIVNYDFTIVEINSEFSILEIKYNTWKINLYSTYGVELYDLNEEVDLIYDTDNIEKLNLTGGIIKSFDNTFSVTIEVENENVFIHLVVDHNMSYNINKFNLVNQYLEMKGDHDTLKSLIEMFNIIKSFHIYTPDSGDEEYREAYEEYNPDERI